MGLRLPPCASPLMFGLPTSSPLPNLTHLAGGAMVRKIEEGRAEAADPAEASESALAKDRLPPGEDAAWANL